VADVGCVDGIRYRTRITAALTSKAPLRLHVYHGYVYPIGRALGIQDVVVGDPPFDEADRTFNVQGRGGVGECGGDGAAARRRLVERRDTRLHRMLSERCGGWQA
jgi:hypothetical protein